MNRTDSDIEGGGALYVQKSSVSVGGCYFIGCSGARGGAVYLNMSKASSSSLLNDCLFEQNQAIYGGAIYLVGAENAPLQLQLNSVRFQNNSATQYGGGLYLDRNALSSISSSGFVSNSAFYGGGIFSASGGFDLQSTIVQLNAATEGAGIFLEAGDISITQGCAFDGNIASAFGAAIRTVSPSSITIGYSTFTNNLAVLGGGM